ncbi:MAG TPA: WD40 repeat domain-containing protein, partial [Nitriliruptoraceae bacterium]|nr:WD40 repeat domain-containing protein [Nitriliruptoraceae bacterium]
ELDAVVLWSTATWDPVLRADAPGWGKVAISPDGEHVAWSSPERTTDPNAGDASATEDSADDLVWVVDRDGRNVATMEWTAGLEVSALDFHPDGDVVAVAANSADGLDSPDNGYVLWDWQDDEVVGVIDTGQEVVAHTFDERGDRLAVTVGPPRSTTELWDVSAAVAGDGMLAGAIDVEHRYVVMEGHVQHVRDVAVSPDDSRVATCGRDGSARLWDAGTGRQLQVLVVDDLTDWCSIAFSPDNRMVAVTDPGNGTSVFVIDPGEVAEIARNRVVRPFTDRECRELLDREACPA